VFQAKSEEDKQKHVEEQEESVADLRHDLDELKQHIDPHAHTKYMDNDLT